MDKNNKSSGLFGLPYSSNDPSMDVPVTSTRAGGILSPYLNFDPAFVSPNAEPEFIFPEGASKQRGRFELAFSQIGSSVLVGAAVGGVNGLYTGLRETSTAQLTGSVRRTQMLNFITKQGASSAQALGTIALMYSVFGVVITWARGVDDEINTVTAATSTGLLYKSAAGWKKCLRGGGVGLGLAATYLLLTSRDRLRMMISRSES